jgi:hypothetical protein
MYTSAIAALTTLLSLTAALPTTDNLSARAGGPSIVPIPSTCSVTCSAPTYPTDAFKPTSAFTTAHGVYSFYLPNDSVTNVSSSYNTCLEQCYGYGNKGDCVSTLWAANVTYQAYGFTNTGYACLMFGAHLTGADLVAVTDGSYTGARGTNIACPPGQKA